MRYVVDCSVAVKWEITEPLSDKARRLRDAFRLGVHQLLAPDLFPTEVANALLVAERRGRILPGQSAVFLADVLTTCPAIHPCLPHLLSQAHAIAAASTNTSVYDALYVSLAQREGCELVTADDRLVRNLQPRFPFIVPLASLP